MIKFDYYCRGGEMVDAHVSGTCEVIHGGSIPLSGTIKNASVKK